MKGSDCGEKKKGVPLYRGNVDDGEKTVLFERTGERNDLAIARSRMLEHRDKGRTILEWGKANKSAPTECWDKRDDLQTCSRSDTYGAPIPFGRQTQARSYRL